MKKIIYEKTKEVDLNKLSDTTSYGRGPPPVPWLIVLWAETTISHKALTKLHVCAQTLVSKYHPPLKGTLALWRYGWFPGWDKKCSRWTGNILLWQKVRNNTLQKKSEGILQGHRNLSEGAFASHIQKIWIIDIKKGNNRLQPIKEDRIDQSMQ